MPHLPSQKIELLVWDMVGTLLNTSNVVPDSFIATASEFGANDFSRNDVVALYSLGVPENMLSHMFKREPLPAEMDFFYATLAAKANDVAVYPGIVECLERIPPSVKNAVFTGASQRSAEILLTSTSLINCFDFVLGGDNSPPKPNPAGLLAAIKTAGTSTSNSAYIGDAPTDMQAARNADVTAIAAGWGHLFNAANVGHMVAFEPAEIVDALPFSCVG